MPKRPRYKCRAERGERSRWIWRKRSHSARRRKRLVRLAVINTRQTATRAENSVPCAPLKVWTVRVGEVRITRDRKTEICRAFDRSEIVRLPEFLMLSARHRKEFFYAKPTQDGNHNRCFAGNWSGPC